MKVSHISRQWPREGDQALHKGGNYTDQQLLSLHAERLKLYFHFNPDDLERVLKIPGMVERLNPIVIELAIDNITSCRALISSEKFPDQIETLNNILTNFESCRWSTPSGRG